MKVKVPTLVLVSFLAVSVAALAEKRCKERCEAERKRLARKLAQCLRDVDPHPRDRAAKTRLLCRKRYVPPRCDGLPRCDAVKEKKPAAPKPALTLGEVVFSAERRGAALAKPRYPAGGEVFLRLDARVVPSLKARRIFLDLSLRMLRLSRTKKGKEQTREVVRWDSYAQEQRMITPPERGLEQRFTLHGGAQLPPDQKPGTYLMEAVVREKGSGFEGKARGRFVVTPARRSKVRKR